MRCCSIVLIIIAIIRFVEVLWLAYDRNLTLFSYVSHYNQAITFMHHLSRKDLPVLKGVTYVEEVYNQPSESITVIHMIYDVRCSAFITTVLLSPPSSL